jgi:cyclopropane fatty-acyl-phospholipid synthase-like methyltransferase
MFMSTNYDEIAGNYKQTRNHPIKQHVEAFTFLKVLGEVEAKSVLDLACGEGYYTRLIKQQGAAQVVGVDISANMISHAQEMENAVPLGIEYRVHDATNCGQLGEFDRVTAVSLFPYASTKQTLTAMCQTMYANLKSGGKLVSITINPYIAEPLDIYGQYGLRMFAEDGLSDGANLTAIIDLPESSIKLSNNYWVQETYEEALQSVGFEEINWRPYQVSEEGVAAYGEEYWRVFLTSPYTLILECQKQ